jgi:hypothetical protein
MPEKKQRHIEASDVTPRIDSDRALWLGAFFALSVQG